jgi:hypothetical protein
MMWFFNFHAAEQGGTLWVEPVCQKDPGAIVHIAPYGYVLLE